MLPHAVARRSSESCSHTCIAPSDGRATRRSPSSMSCRVPAISSSRVTSARPRLRGSSPRGRPVHDRSRVPAARQPIGAPSNAVTGRIPATLDDRNASSAPARSCALEPALERPQADTRAPVEQPRPGRAGQDRAVERRCRQLLRLRRPGSAGRGRCSADVPSEMWSSIVRNSASSAPARRASSRA